MTHLHSVFGLTLGATFYCESLASAEPHAAPDVEIVEGHVARQLPDPARRLSFYDVLHQRTLFRGGPRSGRFLIEGGTTITFEREKACCEPLFRYHLLHQALAAALRQRGLLVLHASCATSSAMTVVVGGATGAGKSTTMAALVARGWRMMSDEITVLRSTDRGKLEVLPGAREAHLHENAATALSLDMTGLASEEWHRGKMAFALAPTRSVLGAVVDTLVLLSVASGGGSDARRIVGHRKAAGLAAMIYGPSYKEQIAKDFDAYAPALSQVSFLSITRPPEAWTMNAVVDAITGRGNNAATITDDAEAVARRRRTRL